MDAARATGRSPWAQVLPWVLAAQLQFSAARVLLRLPPAMGIAATVGVSAVTVIGCHHLLEARDDPARWTTWLSRAGPAVVGGFLALVLAGALVVYPFVDGRRAAGGGADVDDAVLLVVDGLRSGLDNPFAAETYLGNPVTTGPGSALWFLPFGTRALYPLGIVAALVLLFALLRRVTGSWFEPAIAAMLLTVSVPFWEALGQGTDRLVFACGLAVGAVYFDRRAATVPPRAAMVAVVGLGTLATFRVAYLHVPLLVGAALWRQGRRRLGLTVGLGGTAVAVMLHAAFIARSSWDGYTPVHEVFDKSQDDLNGAGRAILVAALIATFVALLVALRRPGGPRVSTMLLIGIGGPMGGIAVATLSSARAPAEWSQGGYLVEALVLAVVVAAATIARRSPSSAPTVGHRALDDPPTPGPIASGRTGVSSVP